jgi:hypothetical protein
VPRRASSTTRVSNTTDVKQTPVVRGCGSARTKPAPSPLDATISALPTSALADRAAIDVLLEVLWAVRQERIRLPDHEGVIADFLIALSSSTAANFERFDAPECDHIITSLSPLRHHPPQ